MTRTTITATVNRRSSYPLWWRLRGKRNKCFLRRRRNVILPGQYYDVETGLNYNHFRQFDPAVGRYTQSDPIGLFGGINTYSYADLDPLNAYDPTGLCWSNARAVAHFFGGGGDESVDQIGCWSELTQKVQPARNV